MNNGIRAQAAILSSLKSFSVRMKRPMTRRKMTTVQKMVIHQHTSKVGLSNLKRREAGGSEYIDICHGPRRSALVDLRGVEGPTSEEKDGAREVRARASATESDSVEVAEGARGHEKAGRHESMATCEGGCVRWYSGG
jgi:hypothetical protein